MKNRRSWRTRLMLYLADHVDQTVQFGDLIEVFEPLIPIEAATRTWANRYPALSTPYIMRRSCLAHALCQYPTLEFKEKRVKGRHLPASATFIPRTRPCRACGAPFFGSFQTTMCGVGCSRDRRNWDRKKAA